MRKLFYTLLPLVIIVISCTKDTLNIDEVDSADLIGEKERVFTSQVIWPTSVQNQEWNEAWFTNRDDHMDYGGTSIVDFQVGYTYLDYDRDGDYDIFLVPESKIIDLRTREKTCCWGPPIILENKGVKNDRRQWAINDDIIQNGGVTRGYRKMASADLDNDGDLDVVGFNAEDPYDGNGNRIMGGIDVFYDIGGTYEMEVVHEYNEGPRNFFHAGSLGDINGDGFVDIVAAGTGLNVYLNDGTGKFTQGFFQTTRFKQNFYDVADLYSLEVFDINQDGLNDLLVGASKKPGIMFYDRVYEKSDWGRPSEIFLNTGTYPFFKDEPDFYLPIEYDYSNEDDETYIYETYGIHYDWSITDFDNDGDYDIFTYTYNNRNTKLISYFENVNGEYISKTETIFKSGHQFFDGDISWIKVYDIDKDGIKEILIDESPRAEFNVWKKVGNTYEKAFLKNTF